MASDQHELTDRELHYRAVDKLNAAHRALGDAAGDLRDLASPKFRRAVAEARVAINRAKDAIGA